MFNINMPIPESNQGPGAPQRGIGPGGSTTPPTGWQPGGEPGIERRIFFAWLDLNIHFGDARRLG